MVKNNCSSNSLKAKTIRYRKLGSQYEFLGYSSNLGLECYLGESLASLEYIDTWALPELIASQNRVLNECRPYKGFAFWGWERKPSIKGVYFPVDWDDTSKALDFLLSLKDRRGFALSEDGAHPLPNAEFWEKELRRSLFDRRDIGNEIILPCKFKTALSVFLASPFRELPIREDPMVTVVTIRTTAKWFPSVVTQMFGSMIELLRRAACVLNYTLEYGIPFSKLSRYYFSIGHYAFRLLEATKILGVDLMEIGINHELLLQKTQGACNLAFTHIHKQNLNSPSHEDIKWWLLTGFLLELINRHDNDLANFFKYSDSGTVMIYRHRRLGHFYTADKWLERLQLWEYNKIVSNCSLKAAA